MKTRITELCGIKYPIILTGMAFVTNTPAFVAAVSNAGGLGNFSPGGMSASQFAENIRAIKKLTSKPFGVNLIPYWPNFDELLDVVFQERVPVCTSGIRSSEKMLNGIKSYGGKYIHSVGSVKQAIRAEKEGVDAVVVAGTEGGGHGGQVSTFVLVPRVVDSVKIPVIAAGGIGDGRGLAAALILGAEGIAMGTRFVVTQESPVPMNIKQRIIKSGEGDTVYSNRTTGMYSRALKNELTKRGRLTLKERISGALELRKVYGDIPLRELIFAGWRMRSAFEKAPLSVLIPGMAKIKDALVDGDEERGYLLCGQVCGMINDIPSCQELIERTVIDAEKVLDKMTEKINNK